MARHLLNLDTASVPVAMAPLVVSWCHSNRINKCRLNGSTTVLCDRISAEEATFQNMQSEDETLSPKEKLSPEAESISRVLVNCISQVKIVASLPAILQFYKKSGVLDQDLSRALQTHQELVERLEKLEGQQQKQTEKEKKKIVKLKNDLKNSVRELVRYFKIHPNVLSGLRAELNVEIEECESMLIGALEKFHDQIVQDLVSDPGENTHKVLQGQPFSSSGKCLHVDENKQQKELEQLEEEICNKHRAIENLQTYLDRFDRQDERKSSPSEKQDEPSSSKLTSLNQEMDQLKAQFNNLVLENHQTQMILHKKNEMLEMEIESLIQTFDKDMKKLQAELEVVEKKYEKEQEEMTMLQESFSLLEVQYNNIQERRRLAEETRKEELRLLEWKNKAAVVIQAWWRGYSVRKAFKNKGESKMGKKSKKITRKGNSKKNK